ncbi:hypothetical protein M8C21_018096 [Ambrosia artemisiifolia]|uniref:Uncharacterized protein n=1 Tax=Ambrosia artemisiifolia TaxID=4212 RepID=A0AAD5GYS3_AMBAR|nr:hypothetical protein M8C21_018096 [Ambrosia artemisiifolia]
MVEVVQFFETYHKPNLDELLKDTPIREFSSVWFEWRKTKFYPTHYSELIRLVALYKYGGFYLDVIVIKPLIRYLIWWAWRMNHLYAQSADASILREYHHSRISMLQSNPLSQARTYKEHEM